MTTDNNADNLATELAREAAHRLQVLAASHRDVTIPEFGALVVPAMRSFLYERFPDLIPVFVEKLLADHIHVTETRLNIEFEALATNVLMYDPSSLLNTFASGHPTIFVAAEDEDGPDTVRMEPRS